MQAPLAHELRAQAGHPTLGQARLMRVEELCRHVAENGVAKELKALIALAGRAVALVGIRAVRERGDEQGAVFEAVADLLFKFIHYCSAFSFIYSILALISSMTPASTKVMA